MSLITGANGQTNPGISIPISEGGSINIKIAYFKLDGE